PDQGHGSSVADEPEIFKCGVTLTDLDRPEGRIGFEHDADAPSPMSALAIRASIIRPAPVPAGALTGPRSKRIVKLFDSGEPARPRPRHSCRTAMATTSVAPTPTAPTGPTRSTSR